MDETTRWLVRLSLYLSFSYIGIVLAMRSNKEDFSLIIPYVRFAPQNKPDNLLLLDTSVIIDGRIADLIEANFLEGLVIVPRFVLKELQQIGDSNDPVRRARGRRGLEMLNRIQRNKKVEVKIHDGDFPEEKEVDAKLVRLARNLGAKLFTNDYNLGKIAELQSVSHVNLHEVSKSLKNVLIPGEILNLRIVREGKDKGQGVGYLNDGTMVVVNQGHNLIGQQVEVQVQSLLQTGAGVIVFAEIKSASDNPAAATCNHSPSASSCDMLKALTLLRNQLPAGEVSFDRAVRELHAGDKWFASHLPDAVALPRSTRSVSALLRFATRHRIPVTPRGAGFGYVGGCVPTRGGIVLSLARLDRIREINDQDFVAVVQPGVTTQRLQDEVERARAVLSARSREPGGLLPGRQHCHQRRRPRCLKYGVTRDYVLGLEVVLADGSVARLGSRTHKNKTGFDLTKLFVGSEGMLGVVTEATLKLLPLPPYRACPAVGFTAMKDAARTIRPIFRAGFLPCALEVADAFTLAAAYKRTGSRRLVGCHALLILELDGQERSVRGEIRAVEKSFANKIRCSSSAVWAGCNARRSGNYAGNFPTPCAIPA